MFRWIDPTTDVLTVSRHTSISCDRCGRSASSPDVEEFPYVFVVVRGAVDVDEHAADLLACSTRLAERYVPADQAAEYGKRNAVDSEMLCRLRIDRWTGYRDIAL